MRKIRDLNHRIRVNVEFHGDMFVKRLCLQPQFIFEVTTVRGVPLSRHKSPYRAHRARCLRTYDIKMLIQKQVTMTASNSVCTIFRATNQFRHHIVRGRYRDFAVASHGPPLDFAMRTEICHVYLKWGGTAVSPGAARW